jgi:hypothetical protein
MNYTHLKSDGGRASVPARFECPRMILLIPKVKRWNLFALLGRTQNCLELCFILVGERGF